MTKVRELAPKILERLKYIERRWEGRDAILEMKKAGSKHWKQMEWIGWYFQLVCCNYLEDLLTIPGPRYGNVEFDAFAGVPFDFKSHAAGKEIIVNDLEALRLACNEYGEVGIVLATGLPTYNDEKGSFRRWHEQLKGGPSRYTIEREKRQRKPRRRKVRFRVHEISVCKLCMHDIEQGGRFQKNFRNADGSPRRARLKISDEDARRLSVLAISL